MPGPVERGDPRLLPNRGRLTRLAEHIALQAGISPEALDAAAPHGTRVDANAVLAALGANRPPTESRTPPPPAPEPIVATIAATPPVVTAAPLSCASSIARWQSTRRCPSDPLNAFTGLARAETGRDIVRADIVARATHAHASAGTGVVLLVPEADPASGPRAAVLDSTLR